ncbi:hypothetical protein SI65_04749 [Aspergillus cristatus]|uniref:Uncharacterized protein n=1 Tax=Aspergillus cristatus TaxID=573508 RepID=A0A1E3BFM6_ASPCR|nr:hypothetical protein SI65_04749 [Aspergillus cristatus]
MSSNYRTEEVFELPGEPVMEPSSIFSSDFGKVGSDLNDDGRIDIDWDSNFVRGFSMLYTDPFLRHPTTPPPEYSELPTQDAGFTEADFRLTAEDGEPTIGQ